MTRVPPSPRYGSRSGPLARLQAGPCRHALRRNRTKVGTLMSFTELGLKFTKRTDWGLRSDDDAAFLSPKSNRRAQGTFAFNFVLDD